MDFFQLTPEQFGKFLAQMMNQGPGTPTASDPLAYPRRAQVTDDETLLMIARMDELTTQMAGIGDRFASLRKQAEALHEDGEILRTEREALKAKVFRRMKLAHPEIVGEARGDGGIGYRSSGDDVYFVGWDNPSQVKESEA